MVSDDAYDERTYDIGYPNKNATDDGLLTNATDNQSIGNGNSGNMNPIFSDQNPLNRNALSSLEQSRDPAIGSNQSLVIHDMEDEGKHSSRLIIAQHYSSLTDDDDDDDESKLDHADDFRLGYVLIARSFEGTPDNRAMARDNF